MKLTRREFNTATTCAVAASALAAVQQPSRRALGQTEPSQPVSATVELPRCRVPLSFIIDDSTCLVNMGRFCMPQFAATYPQRTDYQQPWRDWPAEIPDNFVREFGSWCAEQGVKGKYSIVPYPACVGWLDRTLPGWSQAELRNSLKLVRELMLPNWDIHPEMITHTRVIDLKTGRPHADYSPAHMENSYPQADVSVDYLASYLAYALRILKNCDLPCEGITTPGGFGNRVKDKLPAAVFEAVRDVYGTEVPHYFKYIASGDESANPKLERVASDDGAGATRAVMNVLAGTGDWFGGWEGTVASRGELYCNEDATAGRMVELIERREPAVMLCHWPGMYCNGSLAGYHDFQKIVLSLAARFQDHTQWMKVSEIGHYWAAKELAKISTARDGIVVQSPVSCRDFTLRLSGERRNLVVNADESVAGDAAKMLRPVSTTASLNAGTAHVSAAETVVCFDLPKGTTRLSWGG